MRDFVFGGADGDDPPDAPARTATRPTAARPNGSGVSFDKPASRPPAGPELPGPVPARGRPTATTSPDDVRLPARGCHGMRVVIAGGHGQIALLLIRRLTQAGHHSVGLIRNPDHESDVVAAGGEATAVRPRTPRRRRSRPGARGRRCGGVRRRSGPQERPRAQVDARPRRRREAGRRGRPGPRPPLPDGLGHRARTPSTRSPRRSSRSTCGPRARPTPPCATATSTGRSSGRAG